MPLKISVVFDAETYKTDRIDIACFVVASGRQVWTLNVRKSESETGGGQESMLLHASLSPLLPPAPSSDETSERATRLIRAVDTVQYALYL